MKYRVVPRATSPTAPPAIHEPQAALATVTEVNAVVLRYTRPLEITPARTPHRIAYSLFCCRQRSAVPEPEPVQWI